MLLYYRYPWTLFFIVAFRQRSGQVTHHPLPVQTDDVTLALIVIPKLPEGVNVVPCFCCVPVPVRVLIFIKSSDLNTGCLSAGTVVEVECVKE